MGTATYLPVAYLQDTRNDRSTEANNYLSEEVVLELPAVGVLNNLAKVVHVELTSQASRQRCRCRPQAAAQPRKTSAGKEEKSEESPRREGKREGGGGESSTSE